MQPSVEVALLHEGMALHDASPAALLAGANLAVLGEEWLQFRTATPLGDAQYRLSGLFRGRRGTEWAINAHAPGDRFILVEGESLALLNVPAGTARLRVTAAGMGDTEPPERSIEMPGLALLPPAPVHADTHRDPGGDTDIRWIRRSRQGWRWLDDSDAPLAEEAERYAITMTPDIGVPRIEETVVPAFLYDSAARLADIANGASQIAIAIRQLGTFGASRPAELTIPLI